MKTARTISAILVLSLVAVTAISPMAKAAGSLEPSAPPGPVMKSLDEVEPRIPIHASDLPLTITQRGSYYLTQDVNFTDTGHHAIRVDSNDVTIDLMGYTITGPNSTSYAGIYMFGRTNVEVRNGTVRDFFVAVHEESTSGRGHRIVNVRVASNTYGIGLASSDNLVKDCTAVGNDNYGILVYPNSMVTGNTASYNSTYGIYAGNGSTVAGNTVSYNSTPGINAGIYAGNGCTVTDNTASNNYFQGIYVENGCTVTGNTSSYNFYGISASYGSTVKGNTAIYNGPIGISVSDFCNVIGNNSSYNGNIGIRGLSSNCIEQNRACNNYYCGIYLYSGGNLVVKNSAAGNSINYYDAAGGNMVGTITNNPTTANAWANFAP